MSSTTTAQLSDDRLEQLLSRERLSVYAHQCDGSFRSAIALYRWNATVSAALGSRSATWRWRCVTG